MLILIHQQFVAFYSGDIYLSFGIFVSSKLSFCKCKFLEDFDVLLISSVILLPIKSPFGSSVFWVDLFESFFIASAVDILELSRGFWLY